MKLAKLIAGIGIGTAIGYVTAQQAHIVAQLAKVNVQRSLAEHVSLGEPGCTILAETETDTYTLRHTIEDGIERVSCYPKQRRFETPIVMQHGMWHGAWCWQGWQELLAIMGWESHAHSLPGHAGSPVQRPIHKCTLDYYLAFLKDEIDRQPVKPVLMGHSMGGALAQWYLKHVGDDLPAAVLIGAWDAKMAMNPTDLWGLQTLIPTILPELVARGDAWPMVNSPERTAKGLLSANAPISGDELFSKLTPESLLVLYQHNPPFWKPPKDVKTPLFWLAGSADAVIAESGQRKSAEFYGATYRIAEGAGHDVMLDVGSEHSVRVVHEWLASVVP